MTHAPESPSGRRQNPYPGLRPFRSDETHLYFGRENQVDAMVDTLAGGRFLAVVGTSGSGKSSLVNCGLRPALHRGLMASGGSEWRIAQFRPGVNPIHAMAVALCEPSALFSGEAHEALPADPAALLGIAEATLRMSHLGLVDLAEQARMGADANLLVVVDQFEELFRYRAVDTDGGVDGGAFVQLLIEAVRQRVQPIHVVLTMRSDFLGECSAFGGLPEAINAGQYLVPRMTRAETRRAIVGPVRVAGADISPVLVTRVLNDVGDNPDQLSILQHALNRTWARWQNDGGEAGALDLPHYEAIGTMASALDRHAEKAFGELDASDQTLCAKVFRALTDRGTDPRGVRRPTRLDTLCEIVDAPQAEMLRVLAAFRKPSRSFLMPPDGAAIDADTVVDISHESLMRVWRRLGRWADDEANSARTYRRLADAAALHHEGEASLWRDPELRMALEWNERDAPTRAWAQQYHPGYEAAMAFLRDSRARQVQALAQAEVERRWDKYGLPAIILLVMIPFSVLHELWFRTLMELLGGAADAAFTVPRRLFGMAVFMTPFLLLFWGLAHYGKRVWRQVALPRVLREAPPDALPGREAMTPAPTDPIHYAPTGRRIAAYAIDVAAQLVLFTVIGVAVAAAGPALFGDGRNEEELNTVVGGIMMGIWSASNWLYNVLTVSSSRQGTPGMLALGIGVADLQGRRISFWRATGWHVAKLLSYYTALVGFLVQPFSKRRQTLHDRIARTLVLRRSAAAPAGAVLAPGSQ